MSDVAITQIANIIDPDFDHESESVQADILQLAAECFSVILPTTMEIVSEREALRAENARLKSELDIAEAFQRDWESAYKVRQELTDATNAENARLREALRPFAYALKSEKNPVYAVNIDDFRAARAAMGESDA